MVEFVFLNIWKFDLSNLKHFSKSYELFNFHFIFQKSQILLLGRPTGRPRPVCRPGQCQRRPASEPAQSGARPGCGPREPATRPAQAGRQAGQASKHAPRGESTQAREQGRALFDARCYGRLHYGGAATEGSPERRIRRRQEAAGDGL